MKPPPGVAVADALLAGRYRLLERIAVGGMGEVWRAQDTLIDRVVAVKTLKPEYVGDEGFRARFRAEARHAGRLSHPGIASVHDFGESGDSAWLVLELVDGEPLSTLLRREGALSVDRTLDLVRQTADALHAAHRGGVVHRDVKPGNLLVRPDGVLKVTDFGIASATDAVPLTQTGQVVGTAYYLSPEQAAGRSSSPLSDVYSLGVVAYECLTGARPFPGESPVAVAVAHLREMPPPLPETVPAPVRALVERALAKDPADRFADAADLAGQAERLRAALPADDGGLAALPVAPPAAVRPDGASEPLPVSAHAPTGVLQVPGSRARSSRRAVTAVAALLALLAVGVGVNATRSPQPMRAAAPTPSTAPPVADAVPTEPRTTRIDAARYLGRPAAEVQAALATLGLVPRLAYDGRGTPVGTVSAVDPAGDVAAGSAVLLHVVPAPAPAAASTPAAVAPAAVAPAPVATTPAPAPAVAPAEEPVRAGKSKGKGKR
jgi:serine/threonine-protein kinase